MLVLLQSMNVVRQLVGLTGVSQMLGRREMSVGRFDVVKEAVLLVCERVAEHVLLAAIGL